MKFFFGRSGEWETWGKEGKRDWAEWGGKKRAARAGLKTKWSEEGGRERVFVVILIMSERNLLNETKCQSIRKNAFKKNRVNKFSDYKPNCSDFAWAQVSMESMTWHTNNACSSIRLWLNK